MPKFLQRVTRSWQACNSHLLSSYCPIWHLLTRLPHTFSWKCKWILAIAIHCFHIAQYNQTLTNSIPITQLNIEYYIQMYTTCFISQRSKSENITDDNLVLLNTNSICHSVMSELEHEAESRFLGNRLRVYWRQMTRNERNHPWNHVLVAETMSVCCEL